jgi:NAD(P)-dependent dehydrogenase (short-subunit alcohol dehydrogenase family)
MVTGANTGIGKEIAIGLAKENIHLVIVCRSKERGETAKEEIIQISGNSNVDLFIADLANLKSIKKMTTNFLERYSKLDVLINNAGNFNYSRKITEDGFESTFGVNYLGPFYLTSLLIDLMKRSAPTRIINVSSDMHKFQNINFDDLMLEKKYSSQRAYGASKIALILFTYELASRLEEFNVTVNTLHPGHVKTNMITEKSPLYFKIITKFISFIYTTPKEAADTPIYLALSPEVEGVTGKYFKKRKAVLSKDMTYDKTLQKKMWEISESLISSVI